MKNILILFITALLATAFTGCIKDPEPQTCEYDPCKFKAPVAEVQALRDYLAANNITATEHCSGLFYRIENAGTGKTPIACSVVVANYKGMLTNGNVFDQSSSPIDFSLTGVIQGWTNGVPLIKEGGRIILYIPPSLGYGAQDVRDRNGLVVIPANSNLVFEVDLVGVR